MENNKKQRTGLSKILRKEMIVTMVSIFAVTVLLLGSSYAVFSSVKGSSDYNTIHVGTLDIAYEDTGSGMGDAINLNGAYPMNDVDGLAQDGYQFKITNTGSLSQVFSVKIADDISVIEADGCEENLLDKSQIKLSIDGEDPVILEELAESSYEVVSGTLEAGESKVITLRMWIKGDAGNEVLAKHYHGKITVTAALEELEEGDQTMFRYTGKEQTYTIPLDGKYRLEVWGAQGGNYSTSYLGGKGGYTSGETSFAKDTILYIYVGGQPGSYSETVGSDNAGGYNGGGNGKTYSLSGTTTYTLGGGGASDIRVGGTTLYHRLIVAGGGSGSTSSSNGSAGGGLLGLGETSYGATQETPGLNATFGVGANSSLEAEHKYGSAGGGGGWYGGGSASTASDSDTTYLKYSGGGSGFAFTESSILPSDYLVNAAYSLKNVQLIDGTESLPNASGSGTTIGNSGNGFVRITYLGK